MAAEDAPPPVTARETVVFEKIDGTWKLVHGHVSIPAEDQDWPGGRPPCA